MSTDIELVQTALVEFDRVAAGLAQLEKNYAGVVYDVEEPRGLEHAKAARVALRTPRYEVERIRKSAKAPLLAIGKKLDTEAARITSEIMKLEDPIDQQIKTEEWRKGAEKQAAIAAEARRQADIQTRIAAIRNRASIGTASSAQIDQERADLANLPIDESFAEFQQQATDAKGATLNTLEQLHAAAVAREAEAERIKAERVELARLRAEQEQRDVAERARLAEEDRLARAQRDAANAQQEAANRAERERIAEESRLAREAQAAETERLARERAAFERQLAETRAAQDAVDAKAREEARLASIKKPADAEIIRVLAEHYRVPQAKVKQWLGAMKVKEAA